MGGRRAEEVVAAALAVAARDGLDRLSMRAVAAEIGVTVMALYRHVPGKEALLDAMVGRLLAQIALPGDDLPWRDALRHVAHEMLALARRYPTVLPLLLTRAYVAPEAVRLVRRLYAILDRAGVPQTQIFRLERMYSTFLLGFTVSVANDAFWAEDPTSLAVDQPPRGATGSRPDQWDRELDADVASFCAVVEAAVEAAAAGCR